MREGTSWRKAVPYGVLMVETVLLVLVSRAVLAPVCIHPASMGDCRRHLRELGTAIHRYEKERGALPRTMAELAPYVGDKSVLRCPKGKPYRLIDTHGAWERPIAMCGDHAYITKLWGGLVVRDEPGQLRLWPDGHVQWYPNRREQ